jgi:hypothetical protein
MGETSRIFSYALESQISFPNGPIDEWDKSEEAVESCRTIVADGTEREKTTYLSGQYSYCPNQWPKFS